MPDAARWPVAFPYPSPAAGRLIIAAAAGALTGGAAATVGGGAAVGKGKLTLVVVTAVIKAKLIVAAAILGAAPRMAVVLPEHPHVEGHEAVLPEVEGAPSAQASCAGERLPTASQGHVTCGGDLDPSPRGPTAAAVSLQPEAVEPCGRQLAGEEARKLELAAARERPTATSFPFPPVRRCHTPPPPRHTPPASDPSPPRPPPLFPCRPAARPPAVAPSATTLHAAAP
nr:CASP-like protein 4A1 [Aegilops tauschii subsp. strangulata]